VKLYLSHSIRGKYGTDATVEQMELNCQRAMGIGNWLKKEFPQHEFYVPAEHDLFIQKAYFKGYLTEEQILNVDCDIIAECNALIIYTPDGFISRGMDVEIEFASIWHIPTFTITEPDYMSRITMSDLEEFFKEL